MSNIAQALRAEIARISRKEMKSTVASLHQATTGLKKTVAELKRKIAALESENKRLSTLQSKSRSIQSEAAPEEAGKARITAKGIRALRTKLGLSQETFAKLLGVSSQAVFAMEHRPGRVRLRSATMEKFLAVKGMGRREANKLLNEQDPGSNT